MVPNLAESSGVELELGATRYRSEDYSESQDSRITRVTSADIGALQFLWLHLPAVGHGPALQQEWRRLIHARRHAFQAEGVICELVLEICECRRKHRRFSYRLSDLVKGKSFLHLNAVRYGGGMSEVLRRLVPMMVSLGVDARWEVLAGTQEYFVVVNHMLNALQGRDDKITDQMYHTYSTIMERNAKALKLEADVVMVHDTSRPPRDYRTNGAGSGVAIWIWHSRSAPPDFSSAICVEVRRGDFLALRLCPRLPIPKLLISPSIDP